MITFFRRTSGFNPAPRCTFEDMEKRHSIRDEFNEPRTYGEFMKRYGEIGQRCNFSLPWNTEEMLYRSQQLHILQRSAMALYNAGEIAPISMNKIEKNIGTWKKQLAPAKINVGMRARMSKIVQLVFNFGG